MTVIDVENLPFMCELEKSEGVPYFRLYVVHDLKDAAQKESPDPCCLFNKYKFRNESMKTSLSIRTRSPLHYCQFGIL